MLAGRKTTSWWQTTRPFSLHRDKHHPVPMRRMTADQWPNSSSPGAHTGSQVRLEAFQEQSRCIKNKQKNPPSCCRAPFLHHRGALSCNCRETNHSQLRLSRSLSRQSSEGGRSAADWQAPHGAQVTQQPFDSLFELREAGQRVRRLELAGVVQPGL